MKRSSKLPGPEAPSRTLGPNLVPNGIPGTREKILP
jgi:hypothetical protein